MYKTRLNITLLSKDSFFRKLDKDLSTKHL